LSNEDYEFNTRVRLQGGRIWLNPHIRSVYFARGNLAALARQYARYGFWKWRMLRAYPGTLRWRQALPPLFVLSLLGWLMLGIFSGWVWPWWGLLGELIAYSTLLILGSIPAARKAGDWRLVFAIPLAIVVMHLSWGSGFLWSMIRGLGPQSDTGKG